MKQSFKHIDIKPFELALGAEIIGLDLSNALDDSVFEEVERAFNTYSLLLFRRQALTPGSQVAFSRRFGKLEHHVFSDWCLDGHPEILIVSNIQKDGEPIGVYNAGRYWHTDLSYMQAPSRGSLLFAIEVPHDGKRALGDTYFASAIAAYDALPQSLKDKIEPLKARFSLAHQRQRLIDDGDTKAALTPEQLAATPVATHGLVQRHPLTGRKLLFVNEGHTIEIVGMQKAESDELLAELCSHATQSEFVHRHCWEVGDALMWDNIPTQHLATFDYPYPHRRYMHRTTIMGTEID